MFLQPTLGRVGFCQKEATMKVMMIAVLLSVTALSFAASAQNHGENMLASCTGGSAGGYSSGSCYDACRTFGIC